MKHLHLLMAVVTLAIFLYQAMQVFLGKNGQLAKPVKIATHIIYTLVIGSGLMMALQLTKVIGFPMWVMAKIVLLVVAISSTMKATRATATPVQAKAGMVIAMIAYVAIVVLALTKPM